MSNLSYSLLYLPNYDLGEVPRPSQESCLLSVYNIEKLGDLGPG
jgi:hypothetical protein